MYQVDAAECRKADGVLCYLAQEATGPILRETRLHACCKLGHDLCAATTLELGACDLLHVQRDHVWAAASLNQAAEAVKKQRQPRGQVLEDTSRVVGYQQHPQWAVRAAA